MPQMNKGGKFIFGKSLIRDGGIIQFPEQAIQEYDIASEGKIYLITGSKKQEVFALQEKDFLLLQNLDTYSVIILS